MRLTMAQAKELGVPVNERRRPPSLKTGTKPIPPSDHTGAGDRLFLAACRAHGLPTPVSEYQFAPPRRWKFDWLFDGWLSLEIEGGVWTEGRHVRGGGFLGDVEKYNEAAILGYVVLRCTPADVKSGAAFALVGRALGCEGVQP